MENKTLFEQLSDAYSDENLNKITGILITYYKRKQFRTIREIANRISKYIHIDEENDSKCFSKLIMLYHPDKGDTIRRDIAFHYEKNNVEALNKYAHIFLLHDIENASVAFIPDEDIDYNPEYVWDVQQETGYNSDNDEDVADVERSFYNLIKIREYGNTDVEFPSYYLEDFEEFELAQSGLESLDGVEHCTHLKILDVSDNALTDISELWDLEHVEELYLSNNEIGYIDALANLLKLRVVDLSNNALDDISPLFSLENLEMVTLLGNKIPKSQIEQLQTKGVVVII